ncbi:hypothetical protein KHM83_16560, partial [Fusibacter paucivorans]
MKMINKLLSKTLIFFILLMQFNMGFDLSYTIEDDNTNALVTIITGFAALDEMISEQVVPYATDREALSLPTTLNVDSYVAQDGTETLPSESTLLQDIGWHADPVYTGKEGMYVFSPDLEGYSVEAPEIPMITVIVESEQPVEDIPSGEAPKEDPEAPADEVPSEDTEVPADEAPSDDTEAPADEAPSGDEEVPADAVPSDDTEAPADETPLDDTEVPADEASIGDEEVPADPAPSDGTEVPADETPLDDPEAPADEAPSDDTEAPADETPSDDTKAPADETPSDNTELPADEAPIGDEEVPADEAPSDDTEVPTDEALSDDTEAPMNEVPAESLEEPVEEELFDSIDEASGSEDHPEPLTLAKILSDYEIQEPLTSSVSLFSTFSPSMLLMSRTLATLEAVEPHPETIIIGDDNENNAFTGTSDDDIDNIISGRKANYPIEISFNLDNLPTSTAYIAIKAFDVDEESGEKDYVFINEPAGGQGVSTNAIGALSGNDGAWNTTILQLPISKLKLGKNTIAISVSSGWVVKVDWFQIILDGGEVDTNVSDFYITLSDAVQNGSNVDIVSAVNITQSASTTYYTEYMLTNAAGENLASFFGNATSSESASLSMPLNSPTGIYTVTALIKDTTTEAIKASDSASFEFIQGEVPTFGIRSSAILAPSSLTRGTVDVVVTALNNKPDEISKVTIWYDGIDITNSERENITTASQTFTANGSYTFSIKYIFNGIDRSMPYTVDISNIDTTPPAITAANTTVAEDMRDEDVLATLKQLITVTDNVSLPTDAYTISPSSELSGTLDDKIITITAHDVVGNEATKQITLHITPKPFQLTQAEVNVDETAMTASFSAVLNYSGGLNISESGFVWGVSQNPTYQVCNGKAVHSGSVSKGEAVNATAEEIVKGINYYVRAFVREGETYYYSDQKNFGIGAPKYGIFNVAADATQVSSGGGTATFTITRPADQTEGHQVVYYRTVNGTAIGGLHFVHQTGTVEFAEGEYTKNVVISVNGIARQYSSYPATVFQNNARNFYLEVYKVEGGATLGVKVAQKDIALNSAYQVSAAAYNQYNTVNYGKTNRYTITDSGYSSNSSATDTIAFSGLAGTNANYLDATADHYALKYDLSIAEKNDGYQLMQVTNNSSTFYNARFEHKVSGKNTSTSNYTFPMPSAPSGCAISASGNLTDDNRAINIGKSRTVYVKYNADGSLGDDWYKSNFAPSVRAIDANEPQFLAVAPMAGGPYAFGDEVYVSLIFNEIIKTALSVSINTNLSSTPFSYVQGEGTNVLVFKGIVDNDGQNYNTVTVNNLNGANTITDLADYVGAATSDGSSSTDIDANTIRPTLNFDGSSSGTLPKHTAQVAIGDAISAKYVWTQSSAMPISGWMNFANTSGGTLSETLANGTWYLHVLATHANGNTIWDKKVFEFMQPTMTITVDQTNWVSSRNITLTINNLAPVSVAMTGAATGTYHSSQTINVTENGIYTFTLTDDYGSNIIKTVEIEKVDNIAPVTTIQEYGATSIKYTELNFGVTVSDEESGSGLASIQYKWSGSTEIPETGWLSMTVNGGQIPTYNTNGLAYLHIKATDNAGNITYAHSLGYTVKNDSASPDIAVTGGILSAWQRGNTVINYTVTKTDDPIAYIMIADTVLQNANLPLIYPYSGSLNIDKNGLYMFVTMDENGLSDTEQVVVNYIDNEAPEIAFSFDAGETATSWATHKVVTINANDQTSPVVDSNGTITGYSGSGVSQLFWKKRTDSDYKPISNNSSITIEENTSYNVVAIDVVGNQSEYILSINGIDKIAPTVSITTPSTWQNEDYTAIVSYADDASGVISAKYAVVDNQIEKPNASTLLNMPESGSGVTVSANGSHYIYYEIADRAGNTTSGWSDVINIDQVQPTIDVSGNPETWQKANVVLNVSVSEAGISGQSVKVTKNGGAPQGLDNTTYTVSGNGLYVFTVTTIAGKTASKSVNVTYIDKLPPNQPTISALPDDWQDDAVTLTVIASDSTATAENGKSDIASFVYSADGGSNWSALQTWKSSEANTFTITETKDYTDQILVKVTDNAGNVSAESESYTVKIDKTAPVLTVSANEGTAEGEAYTSDTWTNGNVIFTLRNETTQISDTTYMASVDGAAYETLPSNIFTLSDDVNATYQFKCISGSGIESNVITYKVKIDQTIPETPTVSAIPDGWQDDAVTLTVNASDVTATSESAVSGLASFVYSIDGGNNWSADQIWKPSEANTFTIIDTKDYTDQILVKTTDNAGNVSAASTPYTVKIDKATPVLTVSANKVTADGEAYGSDTWTNGQVFFTLGNTTTQISDTTYMASVDGAAYEALPSNTYTLSDDVNATYQFKCISGSGIESNIITYKVKIDQTIPAAPTASAIPDGWQDDAVTLNVNASDQIATSENAKSGIASFVYSVDGGSNWSAPQTWNTGASNTFVIMDTKDYTDQILVKVMDNAGNVSAASTPYTVKIDKATPVLTVSANKVTADGEAYTSDTWTNGNVIFTLNNSTTQISDTTYMVSVDGGAYQSLPSNSYTLSNDVNATYQFKCISGSGIESNIIMYKVKIDQTIPATPTVSAITDGWQDDAITLTVNASDVTATSESAVSGLASFVYSIDGGNNWSADQIWKPSEANTLTVEETKDYTDQILVKATDNAGNISAASTPYTVKIDKAIPVLTVKANKGTAEGEAYTSDMWTNGNVIFTLNNSTTQISDTTYMVSVNGAAYEALPSNTYTLSNDVNATYQFKCISGSGIESNIIMYKVKIDQTIPATPTVSAITDGWQDDAITLTVNASDVTATSESAVSGLASFVYSVDGGTNWSAPQTWKSGEANTFVITDTKDYTDQILVKATDNAGNVSAASTPYTVKIDKAIPVLTVSANKEAVDGETYTSDTWTNGNVIFTLNNSTTQISDTTYMVSVDGGAYQSLPSNSYTLSDDVNATYQFKCISGSGIESNVITYKVKIDQTIPATPTVSAIPDGWQDDAVTLTVNASDVIATSENAKSGIASFVYSVDSGTNWSSPQDWNAGGSNTFTIEDTEDYTDQILVKVTDNAGNVSVASTPYTVKIDKATPVLTVSANKVTADGETYISDTWVNGNVIFTLNNSATQISDTTYMVSVNGAAYEAIPSNTYTLSNDVNATYQFKCISGSGIASNVITYKVKIDQTIPATPTVSAIPGGWQDDAVTLTVNASDVTATSENAKSGIANFVYSIDGGSNWSAPETWDTSTTNTFTITE